MMHLNQFEPSRRAIFGGLLALYMGLPVGDTLKYNPIFLQAPFLLHTLIKSP